MVRSKKNNNDTTSNLGFEAKLWQYGASPAGKAKFFGRWRHTHDNLCELPRTTTARGHVTCESIQHLLS